MTVVTWGAKALITALVITWGAIGVNAVRIAIRDIVRHWRRRARRDVTLPGPGRPQASGVTTGPDTTISAFTPAQMAFIRGETNTLPPATDIPEGNPS